MKTVKLLIALLTTSIALSQSNDVVLNQKQQLKLISDSTELVLIDNLLLKGKSQLEFDNQIVLVGGDIKVSKKSSIILKRDAHIYHRGVSNYQHDKVTSLQGQVMIEKSKFFQETITPLSTTIIKIYNLTGRLLIKGTYFQVKHKVIDQDLYHVTVGNTSHHFTIPLVK